MEINQPACPLLNQRGADAVMYWEQVLASIDPRTLPPDLQAELGLLRRAACAPPSHPAPPRHRAGAASPTLA